jgi:hypothetical protein
MEAHNADDSQPENEFQAWWETFLADWHQRYPSSSPPTETEARESFYTVWRVWQARERLNKHISNTWQRVEHPRLADG